MSAGVARAIRAARNDDGFWDDFFDTVGAGPCDGGCLIFADALVFAFGGRLVSLARPCGGVDHYGIEIDGCWFDGDGASPSPQAWIARFTALESVSWPLRLVPEYVANPEIPRDLAASRRIGALLAEFY